MQNKKLFAAVTFIAALLLLMTACGGSSTNEISGDGLYYSTDGNYWSSDGNYWYPVATDGNYASAGNFYATDGNYATDGDAYDYSVQTSLYATDGNVDATVLETVRASTVDEFLSALAPGRLVLLAPGTYDLSEASPALYDYCYFRPTFPVDAREESSRELVISRVYDCIIASESGEPADVTILARPRTAAVLKMEECSGVQLRGLTLGHTEGAVCSGEVLSIRASGNIYIANCDLYGCGTIGLSTDACQSVTLADSVIHDCSYGGVSLVGSESILLDTVTFRNVGEFSACSVESSHWVEIRDCSFENNACSAFLHESWSDHVFFDDCSFRDNSFRDLFHLHSSDPPELWRCDISGEQYDRVYPNPSSESVFALMNGEYFHG